MNRNLKSDLALAALILFSLSFFLSCKGSKEKNSTGFISHDLPPGFTLVYEKNGVIVPRSLSFGFESDSHPALKELREREGLDSLVAGGKDELEKMRLLCDWVNNQWPPGKPVPYPPWEANVILERIRAGATGGFCAQYAVVMVQACLSLGWQARYLSIADKEHPDGGHLSVEVWSNQYDKWVVLDPFLNAHFERDGIPQSGLQIHQALISGKAGEIKVVPGQGKHSSGLLQEDMKGLYYYLAVDLRNNHLSRPLHFWDRWDGYLAWEDRGIPPRKDIYSHFTGDPQDFDFPLNQVQVSLSKGPAPDMLRCRLRTNMPDGQTFMIRINDGPWEETRPPYFPDAPGSQRISAELDPRFGSVIVYYLSLKPGLNKFEVAALSRSRVQGPAAEINIKYQPVK